MSNKSDATSAFCCSCFLSKGSINTFNLIERMCGSLCIWIKHLSLHSFIAAVIMCISSDTNDTVDPIVISAISVAVNATVFLLHIHHFCTNNGTSINANNNGGLLLALTINISRSTQLVDCRGAIHAPMDMSMSISLSLVFISLDCSCESIRNRHMKMRKKGDTDILADIIDNIMMPALNHLQLTLVHHILRSNTAEARRQGEEDPEHESNDA
jgi:hypothetical protein